MISGETPMTLWLTKEKENLFPEEIEYNRKPKEFSDILILENKGFKSGHNTFH
jgi:hypothetical protein